MPTGRQWAPKEPVRLVIWDLDETFWKGTLAEGGIQIIPRHCDLVRTLARRGIISTICSKNELEATARVLSECDIWDYFVMPSVTWEAKGPRIQDLVASFKLRPSTVLFIDDNHLNREEALALLPDLQVSDPNIIAHIESLPQLQGKDDPEMTRLHQYKLLQQAQVRRQKSGADNIQFLRESNITVSIEHDVSLHINRAIELINRTNQLNFVKSRLPENPIEARNALMAMLSEHDIQAGLIHVTDRYGDHGFCGIYVLRWPTRLLQFAFSCRILGMGVERWFYERLGRPFVRIDDVPFKLFHDDSTPVDWIRLSENAGETRNSVRKKRAWLAARGGCDLQAVSHYLDFRGSNSVVEFNFNRNGCDVRVDHSMFLRYAIEGLPKGGLQACNSLGYQAQDFQSSLATPREGKGLWLLSFWADAAYALYRHRDSGVTVPWMLRNWHDHTQDVRQALLNDFKDQTFCSRFEAPLDQLKQHFDYVGLIPEALYKSNLRVILNSAPVQTRVFILGANEYLVDHETKLRRYASQFQALNKWTRSVLRWRRNVTMLNIRDFIETEAEVHDWSHFDRMVYFRIYQEIDRTMLQ